MLHYARVMHVASCAGGTLAVLYIGENLKTGKSSVLTSIAALMTTRVPVHIVSFCVLERNKNYVT